jgi:hypothetical protein
MRPAAGIRIDPHHSERFGDLDPHLFFPRTPARREKQHDTYAKDALCPALNVNHRLSCTAIPPNTGDHLRGAH